jgi:hypothetical protein
MKIFKKVTGRLFLVNLDLVGFLYVTTSEKKIALLLIEIFRKNNYGHLGLILGGHFL